MSQEKWTRARIGCVVEVIVLIAFAFFLWQVSRPAENSYKPMKVINLRRELLDR